MTRTLAAAALGLTLVAAAPAARGPGPVRGVPLGSDTGLHLVVASNPPFVLDVDLGRTTSIDAPIGMKVGVLWVVGVGGRSAAVVASSRPRIYAIRDWRPVSLGDGNHAVPAADGRSLWVTTGGPGERCTLRRMSLEGRILRRARPFPCAATLAPGGSAGLVVNRTRVVDPETGRTLRRTRWGVVAGAGRTLVLAGPGRQLTLLDARTGRERRLRWPSAVGRATDAAVDPRGRFVALDAGDPSWNLTGAQVQDVWVLDTRTARLTQLPGMPALLALKFTSMAWTADGRLVMLGEAERGSFVAVWRPGEKQLALKWIALPRRTSGSDSFAPLG